MIPESLLFGAEREILRRGRALPGESRGAGVRRLPQAAGQVQGARRATAARRNPLRAARLRQDDARQGTFHILYDFHNFT